MAITRPFYSDYDIIFNDIACFWLWDEPNGEKNQAF